MGPNTTISIAFHIRIEHLSQREENIKMKAKPNKLWHFCFQLKEKREEKALNFGCKTIFSGFFFYKYDFPLLFWKQTTNKSYKVFFLEWKDRETESNMDNNQFILMKWRSRETQIAPRTVTMQALWYELFEFWQWECLVTTINYLNT